MTGRRVLGIDEAGLGPTLGPLVVAGVRVDEGAMQALVAVEGGPRIADSKVVHAGRDLIALERAAYPALCFAAGSRVFAISDLLGKDAVERAPFLCREPIPRFASAEALAPDVARFEAVLGPVRKGPLGIAVRALEASAFNRALAAGGNKADLEIDLLGEIVGALADEPVDELQCDRLGGRRRYAGILSVWEPGAMPWALEESEQTSSYRIEGGVALGAATFAVGGESRFPAVALASLVAKYLREVGMAAFNAHWQARVPGLVPTAGYPTDAKRFLKDLAAAGIAADEISALRRER